VQVSILKNTMDKLKLSSLNEQQEFDCNSTHLMAGCIYESKFLAVFFNLQPSAYVIHKM